MYWEIIQICPLTPLMGQTGVIKSQILWFFKILSLLLLLLAVLNVLGVHRKPYAGILQRRSDLPLSPYGSHWGHIITDFVFISLSLLLLRFEFIGR